MKKILLYIYFLITTNVTFAQSFYEISWKDDDYSYTGLLVYYSSSDAYMRVGYKDYKNIYRVAEYKIFGKYYTTKDGNQNFYMDGQNAKIVYGPISKNGVSDYSADNFIWTGKNESGKFTKFYTIDDNKISKPDYTEYLEEAFIKELNPKNFTKKYLHDFFEYDEDEYAKMLSYAESSTRLSYATSNTKLNLIIVANTLDNSIGNGCNVDRIKLTNEFKNISEALNIGFSKTVIYGDAFKKDNINKALNELNPGSNDIVVFFYRGHGFRWSNQKSSWPQMSMRYSNYQKLDGMGLDEVYNAIVQKGARLNLVFGDLCNNDIGISQPDNQPSNFLQSSFYPSIEKLKRLFLISKGNLLSAAARPGEVSWVNQYDGGFYTSSFFEALYKEVSINTGYGDWNNLIDNTINNARYKSANGCKSCSVQNGIKYTSIKY